MARSLAGSAAGRGGRWWTLGAMTMAMFMIFLDVTIVNVALPSIQRDLKASISDLQWVLDAYSLVVGVLLITGGRFGDIFGRRKVVLAGVAVFTLGSLVAALSGSIEVLIAARALQGLGGAMLIPGTLSIIANSFEGHERGMAIGIWSGASGVAIALGPVVGGILVQQASWQSIFYINVPLGIFAIVVGLLTVPESRDETASQRIDVPGVALISLALLALSLAFVQGNEKGWGSTYIVGLLATGTVLLLLFILVESRVKNPLLDLRLFRSPTFSAGNTAAFTTAFGMFAYFFFITLYLQDVLGYSPLQTGLRLLPQSAMGAIIAPIAGRLTDRIGTRVPLAIGQTLLALSLVAATRWTVDMTYAELLPSFILAGVGFGLSNTPLAATIMGAVPRQRAGAASGVMNTMRQIGGTLGIAALGALFTHQVAAQFAERGRALGLGEALSRSLGPSVASTGAQAVAGLPHELVAAATAAAKSAFVSGLTTTLYANAAIVFVGALAAALFVRRPAPESIESVDNEAADRVAAAGFVGE
jgi:EmrB/QacA subfamily drug resistance transporter